MTSLRSVGWALLGVLLLLPLQAACTCGPSNPSPPIQQTCDASGTTWSGVTAVRVTRAMTVYGPQGGMHNEVDFEADGASLPDCAAYTIYSGDTVFESGTVRGDVTDGTFYSRGIILTFLPPSPISVEVFGMRSPGFGAPADAGTDAPAGEEDAGELDAPEGADAGEEDAGEPDAPEEADAGEADAG